MTPCRYPGRTAPVKGRSPNARTLHVPWSNSVSDLSVDRYASPERLPRKVAYENAGWSVNTIRKPGVRSRDTGLAGAAV